MDKQMPWLGNQFLYLKGKHSIYYELQVSFYFTLFSFLSFHSLISHNALFAVSTRQTHNALHSLFTLGALPSSSPSGAFVSFLTGRTWYTHFFQWLTQ